VPPSELAAHGLSGGLSTAAQDAVETSIRKGVARKIGPMSMRATDATLRGVDKALTDVSRGSWGVTPEFRRRAMEFSARNPVSLLGAAAIVIPFPAAAPLGIAASGSISHGAKKMLKIPTHPEESFKVLEKQLRERGYYDVMDYLVKSKAKFTIPRLSESIAFHSPTRTSIF